MPLQPVLIATLLSPLLLFVPGGLWLMPWAPLACLYILFTGRAR